MFALEVAARATLHAPPVFNTQPWTWRIAGDTTGSHAGPTHRLDSTDIEGPPSPRREPGDVIFTEQSS